MSAHSLLGFTIERRAGVDVVVFSNDSCRPAMETEVAMWNRLALSPNPITHLVVADVQELGTVTCGYSGQPSEIARAVMAKACAQGYAGTYPERMAELGWRVEPVYLAPSQEAQSFQDGVSDWMAQCFVPSLYCNMTERGDRLLEEVLELLQAHGYDQARVPTLVSYVFGRPVGEPAQEVGGVMVTLAGYCCVAGLNMHAAGAAELARIAQPDVMAKIRSKQEAKNALHFDTPLPGQPAVLAPAAPGLNLEHFRPAVRAYRFRQQEFGSIAGMAEADRLEALIDEQTSANPQLHAYLQAVAGLDFDAPMDAVERTVDPKGDAPRGDLVPGVVRCAKCSFQLTRTNLYLGSGTTGPGGSETEPCPNGCGPLWPVTWQTWATEGWEQAERYHDELRQMQGSPKRASMPPLGFEAWVDGEYGLGVLSEGELDLAFAAWKAAMKATGAEVQP